MVERLVLLEFAAYKTACHAVGGANGALTSVAAETDLVSLPVAEWGVFSNTLKTLPEDEEVKSLVLRTVRQHRNYRDETEEPGM